jgi:DNA-binding beta-propeller fold protein YncE
MLAIATNNLGVRTIYVFTPDGVPCDINPTRLTIEGNRLSFTDYRGNCINSINLTQDPFIIEPCVRNVLEFKQPDVLTSGTIHGINFLVGCDKTLGFYRIFIIKHDDVVETLIGGDESGFNDGPIANATITEIEAITVGPDGTIYFIDRSRIRAISPDGIVRTIAGSDHGFEDGPGHLARFNLPAGLAVTPDNTIYVTDRLHP